MSVQCRTAGLTVQVESENPQWRAFAMEASAGQQLEHQVAEEKVDVMVLVADSTRPFDRTGYTPLTRGAWSKGKTVLLEDACGSGADLLIAVGGDVVRVIARIRPTWRHKGLGVLDRSRQVLLHRAAIIQYPALWWAGVHGMAPLHVSAAEVGGAALVLAGPGGVGKSTLINGALASHGLPASDNLCVTDGTVVHGLLEPARREEGAGRRMPHGRRESPWATRIESVRPDHVLVLRRGSGPTALVRPVDTEVVVREMVGGTYAAGELRRYWAFAATLALGTGCGPAHASVEAAARRLADGIPASEVVLPAVPGTTLAALAEQAMGAPRPDLAAGTVVHDHAHDLRSAS
jgi:hypothetical protein